VPLIVHTARISYGGPDRLDITRANAHNVGDVMGRECAGAIFAPSWGILNRAIREIEAAGRMKACGQLQRADHAQQASWKKYERAYIEEMRASYRQHRQQWEALLARDVVTLVCYCVDHLRCHRTVLATILGKLGAEVKGERSRSCVWS